MRVLHVIPSVSPRRGGPSVAVVQMVKTLASRGVNVEIATTNDHGNDTLDVPLNEQVEFQGATVRFFQRFSPPVNPVREFAWSSPFRRWITSNISRYTIVHAHAIFSFVPTFTMLSARRQSVPYIVRPLGQLDEWSLTQAKHKKALYMSLLERKNINGAARIHCTSKNESETISRLGLIPKREIIPHGILQTQPPPEAASKLREKYSLPKNQPILLFLSRLHPKKGFDILIPALSKYSEHPFSLIIAGQGTSDYESNLRHEIEKNGLARNTIFAGFVEGENKSLLLAGADLFVLPSYDENFGIAALEALAHGLPVLLTNTVDLADFVQKEHAGFVCGASSDGIVSGLDQAFSSFDTIRDPAFRNGIKEKTERQFDWQVVASRLESVYQNITSAPPFSNRNC
ncbi:MAG: glycosyltransferase [Verrucomicrobiota bacterium]